MEKKMNAPMVLRQTDTTIIERTPTDLIDEALIVADEDSFMVGRRNCNRIIVSIFCVGLLVGGALFGNVTINHTNSLFLPMHINYFNNENISTKNQYSKEPLSHSNIYYIEGGDHQNYNNDKYGHEHYNNLHLDETKNGLRRGSGFRRSHEDHIHVGIFSRFGSWHDGISGGYHKGNERLKEKKFSRSFFS